MTSTDIVQLPLDKLFLERRFEYQCREMGFNTLEDILVLSPEELLAMPGFSYHWLGQLSAILSKHGLLHLLQPIPGRNFG